MDFNFLGTMLDPAKCSKLSMEKKRELVYELSKHPHGTPDMLLSWSRQEILQLLCMEMGKERKYTGLTKLKIIENLLKIMSEKNTRECGSRVSEHPIFDSSANRAPRSLRRPDSVLSRSSTLTTSHSVSNFGGDLCKNSACKASLSSHDAFCKRCSCCICRKFDDNKDPSLWLTCSSEAPFEGESCNMSCHLECALRHGKSGLSEKGQVAQLDGGFYCVFCGKMNDLLRCWRKQLVIARDTRRVDILCYRVSLSQKLICGTDKYQNLSDIVDEVVNKLQAEVGTLTDMTVKTGRGIVNRMSTGQQIQRLCASAVELLDSMLSQATAQEQSHPAGQDSRTLAANTIRFEGVSDTSVAVILGPSNQTRDLNMRYTLWHHKAVGENETPQQACTPSPPGTRVVVQGLSPSTEYVFKVVSFDGVQEHGTHEARLSTGSPTREIVPRTTPEGSQSPVTNFSTLSNPSSVEDETNNITSNLDESNRVVDNGSSVCASNAKHVLNNGISHDHSGAVQLEKKQESLVCEPNGSITPSRTGLEIVPCPPPEMGLPTPCRTDILETIGRNGRYKSSKKDLVEKFGINEDDPLPRSISKKRNREIQDEGACDGNAEIEFYIKVIRSLECDGHIEKSFRQKFLTWYSLRATPQEMHVVRVFINTLRDDPVCLAEQLIDSFEDIISNKRPGFCMKLWH